MAAAFDIRRSGEVQAIVCRPLEEAGFLNAFSTKPGGVNAMPKDALNLAFNEDAPAHVEENRRRFLRAAGIPSWPILTARQTHSAQVVEVRADAAPEREGDAVFTRDAAALVGVKTADCVPVLVGDAASGLVCGIHSGWRGTVLNVIGAAVSALRAAGGSADSLLAAIGPSACVRCFEVGPEVVEQFEGLGFAGASLRVDGKLHLDLVDVCEQQLRAAGVSAGRIYRAERCTMHEGDLFFSHRREGKQGRPVGRMLSVIGRRP